MVQEKILAETILNFNNKIQQKFFIYLLEKW